MFFPKPKKINYNHYKENIKNPILNYNKGDYNFIVRNTKGRYVMSYILIFIYPWPKVFHILSVISLQFGACCVFLERGETFKPGLYWG